MLRRLTLQMSIACVVLLIKYLVMSTIVREVKCHLRCQEPEVMPSPDIPITRLESDTMAMLRSYNQGIIRGVPCIFHNVRRELMNSTTSPQNYVADNDRGVCQWHYVKNIDENRIPSLLYEARCSTSQCDGCQSDSHNIIGNKCKEIYFYISVLRRVACLNNIYQYDTVLEPLSAGCTCLGPAPSTPIEISRGSTAPPGLKANT